MTIKFKMTLLVVEDMPASREFYEALLGLTVEQDLGDYVVYTCGLALWRGARARQVIFGKDTGAEPVAGTEVYFETDTIEGEADRFREAGVRFIHPIKEEPWGQRTFRVRDPDGNVVEVGEPMRLVIERLIKTGMAYELVAQVTGMPMELILQIIGYPRFC